MLILCCLWVVLCRFVYYAEDVATRGGLCGDHWPTGWFFVHDPALHGHHGEWGRWTPYEWENPRCERGKSLV